jgi:hypothetical protein
MAKLEEVSKISSKYTYSALQLYFFQIYHFEKHHKGYINLSKEIMSLLGIGFNDTSQRGYFRPE